MTKRAAKELTKVDVVVRDLENLQPDQVREEFFQKCSVDGLKEYLQIKDRQVSIQGRQLKRTNYPVLPWDTVAPDCRPFQGSKQVI